MKANVCNDPDINRWNLSMFPSLRVVIVGDNCLQQLKGLVIDGFKCLEKVEIGVTCCRREMNCRFEVSGCEKLKRVAIGDGSCVNWNEFVMKDCGVEEVSIGDGCFVNCKNTVFESGCCLYRVMTRFEGVEEGGYGKGHVQRGGGEEEFPGSAELE